MTQTIVGWDIGGAHLKAALVDSTGNAIQVIQLSCPLWRGLDVLELAIDEVLTTFSAYNSKTHAITMTGELADIFPNRNKGILQITQLIEAKLNGEKKYYAGQRGFVNFEQVKKSTQEIASANWIASAVFIAQRQPQALLVDMGSTTTDFMMIAHHQLMCRGFDDAKRMQFEELIYSGMLRTPIMAVASKVPFAGEWCTVAAEHFATMADVYRLTDDLTGSQDMSETADGKGKTLEDSIRRLARMIGHDAEDADISAWKALAYAVKQAQLDTLHQAALRQLSRLDSNNHKILLDSSSPIIGIGVGVEIIKVLAQQLNRPFINAKDMIIASSLVAKDWVNVCFPAYAVANLVLHL